MMRCHRAILVVFLAWTAAAAAPAMDSGADLERIRRRIEDATVNVANGLIAEQTSDRDKGDVALVIGAMFESGQLENDDPLTALEFYRIAAEFGAPEADCALGNIYFQGAPDSGIPQDRERAREHYERAAANGSVAAMVRLGLIYEDGMGVEPDSKRALDYFVKAAARGDDAALEHLEPVMRQARKWEEERGTKANFPTTREQMVDKALAKEVSGRDAKLDRLASRMYVQVNARVAAAMKSSTPSLPVITRD